MDKVTIVFWSQSGNTESMANAVAEGVTAAGKEAVVVDVASASLDDLKGKKIAVQTGSTGEEAAKEIEGADVTGLKNAQDIMNALSANQYDAAVVDLGVAKNYVSNGTFTMLDDSL